MVFPFLSLVFRCVKARTSKNSRKSLYPRLEEVIKEVNQETETDSENNEEVPSWSEKCFEKKGKDETVVVPPLIDFEAIDKRISPYKNAKEEIDSDFWLAGHWVGVKFTMKEI